MIKDIRSHSYVKLATALLCAVSLMAGCEQAEETNPTPGLFDLALPDSVTGGRDLSANHVLAAKASANIAMAAQTSDVPCQYLGADPDDPFRNGYEMTKFMVSAVAVWTCVADNAIAISETIPHDGVIIATENDMSSSTYDPTEPTHFSVSDDSATQSTIRLYYGYAVDAPPTANDLAGIYLSWDINEADDLQGRFIIDTAGMSAANTKPGDPIAMRLDFDNNSSRKLANMYLLFDSGNQYADGFRIEVNKDLTAPLDAHVFTARGLMSMKGQFMPANGVTELPTMKMFTVSDAMGEGAAIAEFLDVALPLELTLNNHLGNYIFSKEDIYFFAANQNSAKPWDWIAKTILSSQYRGGRTTPATGGTFVPFNPSLDLIIDALQLDANYFTGAQCGDLNSDCNAFLSAVVNDGFAGQEKNQGSQPADWRAVAMQSALYLDSVLPVGDTWATAFEQSFNPVP